MKGHPLRPSSSEALVWVPSSHFVFEQVASSIRTVMPYIGDPRLGKFGEQYTETDGPFRNGIDGREYGFEGRLDDSNAFVDWVIRAASFTLEIPG
jgi:hypothetical protein